MPAGFEAPVPWPCAAARGEAGGTRTSATDASAGGGYNPYLRWNDSLYGDYDAYGQSSASQYWYYCTDPAGYYPYVSECSVTWQTAPAG
jgi:hypothetical protein